MLRLLNIRDRTAHSPLHLLVGAFTVVLVLGACGSQNATVDLTKLRAMDEVTVVSISTSKAYRADLDGMSKRAEGSLGEALNEVKEDAKTQERRADPSFQAAMDRTREYLFGEFQSSIPVSLSDEEPILQSQKYQNFTVTSGPLSDVAAERSSNSTVTPKQYRSFDPDYLKRGNTLEELLGILPSDPDGVLIAETRYTLLKDNVKHEERDERTERAKKSREEFKKVAKSSPSLTASDTVSVDVKARTTIKVLDAGGATVFRTTERARSDEAFTFIFGKGWDADQIRGPTLQATEEALKEATATLQERLPEN